MEYIALFNFILRGAFTMDVSEQMRQALEELESAHSMFNFASGEFEIDVANSLITAATHKVEAMRRLAVEYYEPRVIPTELTIYQKIKRRIKAMEEVLKQTGIGVLIFICCSWIDLTFNPKEDFKSQQVFAMSAPVSNTIPISHVVVTQAPKQESKPIETKEVVVDVLNGLLKGPLTNKGELIYDECKSQTPPVNSKLMTSIILLEVGADCNSDVLKNASNVGGLNWFKGCGYPKYKKWYIDFSKNGGVDASIKMKASILSRYIREGRNDIVSIGLKYAPPNDSRNGIGGMNNKKWADNVEARFNQITREVDSRLLHML